MENIEQKTEVNQDDKDKSPRIRVANIMQYEEFLSEEKIKSVLNSYKQIEKFAYIKHDKDKAEPYPEWQIADLRNCDNAITKEMIEIRKNELKKPHFHIVLKLKNAISINAIAKWFNIKPNYVENAKGREAFMQCVQYLTHENKKQQEIGKHKYDDAEIIANFDFRKELEEYAENKVLKKVGGKKYTLRNQVRLKGLALSQINQDDYVADMQTLKICRLEYLRKVAPLPKIRINYYVTGKSGTGKSLSSRMLAKALIDPNNNLPDDEVYFVAGQGASKFQGYDGQPVIIWDDTRAFDLLKYYGNNAGAIFNVFDVIPSSSEQNIKFGSVKLVNTINIVNSVETLEEFCNIICFKNEQAGIDDPDKQIYRRFPFFIELNENEKYDFFVNKQFFNEEEPNYKAYKMFKNLGLGLKKIERAHKEKEKKLELNNKHFEEPKNKYDEAITLFDDKENIDLQQELDFAYKNKIIEVEDYIIENKLTEEEQKEQEIKELEEKLRVLKNAKSWNDVVTEKKSGWGN